MSGFLLVLFCVCFFFFKQKTAYEMRISDWSSDVCSSDLLAELFEDLPEVGDLPKPKLVFFSDEAHLLFDDAPDVLLEKVEQVVRLIRSKGVGVIFVTQHPPDVPVEVLGKLGNRVQNALRAITPLDQKQVRSEETTVGER